MWEVQGSHFYSDQTLKCRSPFQIITTVFTIRAHAECDSVTLARQKESRMFKYHVLRPMPQKINKYFSIFY